MNVSYEWLRAFVPFHETPAKLRDLITSRVATVDELVPLRADLAPIVIARVVEAAPHPDSDHLWVTRVDDGSGTTSCAARPMCKPENSTLSRRAARRCLTG